jgi:hypothetical protein
MSPGYSVRYPFLLEIVLIPFVMLSVHEIVDVLYPGKGLSVHILTTGRALRQLTFSHWPMKAIGFSMATIAGLQFNRNQEGLSIQYRTAYSLIPLFTSYLILMTSQLILTYESIIF